MMTDMEFFKANPDRRFRVRFMDREESAQHGNHIDGEDKLAIVEVNGARNGCTAIFVNVIGYVADTDEDAQNLLSGMSKSSAFDHDTSNVPFFHERTGHPTLHLVSQDYSRTIEDIGSAVKGLSDIIQDLRAISEPLCWIRRQFEFRCDQSAEIVDDVSGIKNEVLAEAIRIQQILFQHFPVSIQDDGDAW